MNVNKININQSESSYYIASDIYDVSYHNNDAVFESLSSLLGSDNLSTLIPTAVRCGGMTIRFIQSSNNKYVQYRLMSNVWSTTVADWQGVDDEPTVGSDNLVKSGGVTDTINQLKVGCLKKIPVLNAEICRNGRKYTAIENLILDLEIISENDRNFAPVVFNFDGTTNFKIAFYEVDETGKYLTTFKAFVIDFGSTERKLLYVLDEQITVDGYRAKVSIAIDASALTSKFDAYSPSLVSSECKKEHWGLISILRDIQSNQKRFKVIDSKIEGLVVQQVNNGNKVTYLTTANNMGGCVSNVTSNSFEISTANEGFTWCYTNPPFTPSGNNYIHVNCKLEDLTLDLEGSQNVVDMWLSDGRMTYDKDGCVFVGSFSTAIDYEFDPAYYTVYKNWSQFGVWLAISAKSSGGTKRWRVTDFEVYEVLESVNGLSGNNAKELFEDVASKISDINSEIEGLDEVDNELISPSGNKFELSVQDDGTLKALPIIPNKGAFFGNSLLSGSGYGMAASDEQHDYYYLINSYIKSLNGSYTYNKYSSYGFEGITSEDAIESAVNAIVNNLTGDETLVSIQLGDNVNTTEKNAVFPASSLALCKAVRAKCPNARVVWMGMWYSSDSKYQAIQNACKQTGCKFISYEGLKGSDANSKIGNIQKKSSAQRTISNVTNVVENSSSESNKNITVTFTVSESSYTSTLDVSNYSLSEGTLTYTSEYEIITAGGVASHPGDEGFRRISNRFLYEMKLTYEQEYYK